MPTDRPDTEELKPVTPNVSRFDDKPATAQSRLR